MGAVLSQLDAEGVEHPIGYASRSCNLAEQNYSSFDGKCVAVVWATNHFRAYLFGNSFTLVIDQSMTRMTITPPMADDYSKADRQDGKVEPPPPRVRLHGASSGRSGQHQC